MVIPAILVIDRTLRDAGVPIDGVSVGSLSDRTTWAACYKDVATAAHRTQGDALLLTLDPQDPTTVANIKADISIGVADADVAKALATALWECIPAPTMTKLQLRARVLALLRSF